MRILVLYIGSQNGSELPKSHWREQKVNGRSGTQCNMSRLLTDLYPNDCWFCGLNDMTVIISISLLSFFVSSNHHGRNKRTRKGKFQLELQRDTIFLSNTVELGTNCACRLFHSSRQPLFNVKRK